MKKCIRCGGVGCLTAPLGAHGEQVFDRWCTCRAGRAGMAAAVAAVDERRRVQDAARP